MHAHVACTKVRLKPLNGGAKHDLISGGKRFPRRGIAIMCRESKTRRTSAFPGNNVAICYRHKVVV